MVDALSPTKIDKEWRVAAVSRCGGGGQEIGMGGAARGGEGRLAGMRSSCGRRRLGYGDRMALTTSVFVLYTVMVMVLVGRGTYTVHEKRTRDFGVGVVCFVIACRVFFRDVRLMRVLASCFPWLPSRVCRW